MASRQKRKKVWREQQYKPGFVKKLKQELGSIHDELQKREAKHE